MDLTRRWCPTCRIETVHSRGYFRLPGSRLLTVLWILLLPLAYLWPWACTACQGCYDRRPRAPRRGASGPGIGAPPSGAGRRWAVKLPPSRRPERQGGRPHRPGLAGEFACRRRPGRCATCGGAGRVRYLAQVGPGGWWFEPVPAVRAAGGLPCPDCGGRGQAGGP